MKQTLLVLTALAISLVAAASAPAQEIRYRGLSPGTERGLIHMKDQYYTVGKGDEIPGLGTVLDVTHETLIVRRSLTEAEKQRLAEQGRIVVDVETRHIPDVAGRRVGPLLQQCGPGLSR